MPRRRRRARLVALLVPIALSLWVLVAATPASAQSIKSSGDISVAIPEGTTETLSTISTSSSGTITDLNIDVRITHPRDADLKVFLVAPSGQRVELFTDVGGTGDNFGSGSTSCSGTFTTLDSQSSNLMTNCAGCPSKAPYNGVWKPEGDLNQLNGTAKAGSWKLSLLDPTVNGQAGTLHCWQLVFDSDSDGDGLLDGPDNCTYVANPTQLDTDRDNMGDACDTDDDNDTVPDATDNCPLAPNPDQRDGNGNGKGDVCDDDPDGDGIIATDNCPTVANPDQQNTDKNFTAGGGMPAGDSLGDACDPDDDADGITDSPPADNCPLNRNVDQKDTDNDGSGDVCDADIDGDGLANGVDPYPADPDGDDDGLGDGDETTLGTQLNDPDTDGDLHRDGTEVEYGSDPKNPFSIPGATPGNPITLPGQPPFSEMPGTDSLGPVR